MPIGVISVTSANVNAGTSPAATRMNPGSAWPRLPRKRRPSEVTTSNRRVDVIWTIFAHSIWIVPLIGLELQLALLENIDLAGEVIAVDEDDDVGFLGNDGAQAERDRAR